MEDCFDCPTREMTTTTTTTTTSSTCWAIERENTYRHAQNLLLLRHCDIPFLAVKREEWRWREKTKLCYEGRGRKSREYILRPTGGLGLQGGADEKFRSGDKEAGPVFTFVWAPAATSPPNLPGPLAGLLKHRARTILLHLDQIGQPCSCWQPLTAHATLACPAVTVRLPALPVKPERLQSIL